MGAKVDFVVPIVPVDDATMNTELALGYDTALAEMLGGAQPGRAAPTGLPHTAWIFTTSPVDGAAIIWPPPM